jgi:hypothetical protein
LDVSKAVMLYKFGDPSYKPQQIPPNEVIREYYHKFENNADETEIERLAEIVVLSVAEV